MKRLWLGLGTFLLVAAMSVPVFAQLPPDLTPTCIGQSGFITVTANLQTLAAALEVDLFIANSGAVAVRVDPAQAVLTTAESVQTPWTADEVKRAHRDLGAYIVAGALFPPLLALTGISQLNFNRYVDGRALRVGEVAPGQTLRGSIFFPMPPEAQARAALDLTGFVPVSGTLRPVKLYCALPRGASAHVVSGVFAPLTVSLRVSASSGAAEVAVDAVEFSPEYTAVELRISNTGETPVEIFGAMVNASVRDGAGTTYAGRPARSDFGDRVPAKQTSAARLVFAPLPLPPTTAVATLTIPRVWFGPEDAVDLTVVLRF
jgi:hypothetical protein